MDETLVKEALRMREFSYCPYSDFAVGAALLGKSGKIYTGCNIENAAFTPTNCGERTAFFTAISQGEREFVKIAIAGGKRGDKELSLCAPCGVCRQVMMEFCDEDSFEILLVTSKNQWETYKLKELLPLGFKPEKVRGK